MNEGNSRVSALNRNHISSNVVNLHHAAPGLLRVTTNFQVTILIVRANTLLKRQINVMNIRVDAGIRRRLLTCVTLRNLQPI